MRLTYTDARRGAKQADLCDDCAGTMPGRAAARRGRRPKSAAAELGGAGATRLSDFSRSFLAFGARRSGAVGHPALRWAGAAPLLAGPANAGKVALLLDRYLDALEREPCSSCRTGRTSTASSATCSRARRPPRGSIGTFDDLFERLVRDVRRRAASRPTRSGRSSCAARSPCAAERPRRLGPFRRLRRRAARDARRARVGPARPGRPRRRPGRLYAAYRAELDRLGLWDRDLLRRRAASASQSDLDAWHGEPVFAYGFEDLTGAEWTLLEALAGRTEVRSRCPTSRAAPRSRRSAARPRISPRSPRAGSRSCRRASGEYAHAGARAPRADLFEEARRPAPSARRRGPLPRGRRRARHARARRRGDARAARARYAARADRRRLPVASSVSRAPLETAFGALGIPYAVEGRVGSRRRRSATRCSRCFASPGSAAGAATSSRSCARRTRASRRAGRLRRGAAARARGPARRSAWSRRRRSCRGAAAAGARAARRQRRRSRRCARSRRDAARRVRARAPAGGRDVAARPARLRGCARLLDELERWAGSAGVTRDDVVAALERATVAPRSAREPGRVAVARPPARAHAPFRRRLRARARGGKPAAARAVVAVPRRRRRGARSTSAARLQRPDPVEPRPLPLLHRVHAAARAAHLVREAATDDGGPREPSPFWDEVRAFFPADDVPAGRGAGRCRR